MRTPSWFTDRELEEEASSLFLQGHQFHFRRAPPSQPNSLPGAPPPNSVTLRFRNSTYEFFERGHKHSTHNIYLVLGHTATYIETGREKYLLGCFLLLKTLLYFAQDTNSHYNQNQNEPITRYFYNNYLFWKKKIYFICSEFF